MLCDSAAAGNGEATGAAVLHTADGTGCQGSGEANLSVGGTMCLARWEASANVLSLFSGLMSTYEPPTLTYEVEVVPSTHLALVQRQRVVQLAERGRVEELRAVLAGLGVGAADDRGRTALHGAAAAGHAAAVGLLLTLRAPLEYRGHDGRTPLLEACARRRVDAIVSLLDAGADLAAVDAVGRNALHLVVAAE